MDILKIEDLHKSFGKNKVIDGLCMNIPEHSVFGFIGQNGAGKTTTMKMILGLLKPDSGNIYVCGKPVSFGQTETNKYIGYLPDVPSFYSYMTPSEYLNFCGEIIGMDGEKVKSRSKELLEMVGLDGCNKKISGFSRGMKQRLGIAQALFGEPKLLICDEPTSALDPIGRKEILDILLSIKGKTTVVFSTHILADVERICDNVALLNNGKISVSGSIHDIKKQYNSNMLTVEFSTENDKDIFISEIPEYNIASSYCTLNINTDNISQTQEKFMRIMLDKNIMPLKFEVVEPTIENLFLEEVSQ